MENRVFSDQDREGKWSEPGIDTAVAMKFLNEAEAAVSAGFGAATGAIKRAVDWLHDVTIHGTEDGGHGKSAESPTKVQIGSPSAPREISVAITDGSKGYVTKDTSTGEGRISNGGTGLPSEHKN